MSQGRHLVTVSETFRVARPPEAVFDYTQDYGRRSQWDQAVLDATVLSEDPRRVRVRVRGIGSFTVEYRLFRRPERTSAAFVDPDSRWLIGGGGSWSYEPDGEGTAWTQTNTMESRSNWILGLLAPLFERQLRSSMRQAMARARDILEAS